MCEDFDVDKQHVFSPPKTKYDSLQTIDHRAALDEKDGRPRRPLRQKKRRLLRITSFDALEESTPS